MKLVRSIIIIFQSFFFQKIALKPIKIFFWKLSFFANACVLRQAWLSGCHGYFVFFLSLPFYRFLMIINYCYFKIIVDDNNAKNIFHIALTINIINVMVAIAGSENSLSSNTGQVLEYWRTAELCWSCLSWKTRFYWNKGNIWVYIIYIGTFVYTHILRYIVHRVTSEGCQHFSVIINTSIVYFGCMCLWYILMVTGHFLIT